MKGRPLTESQKQYIIDHYETMRNGDIAKYLGISADGVKGYAYKKGMHKPKDFFVKCTSEYTMTDAHREKISKTWFKKENRPSRSRPVGSERDVRDGIEIKIYEPNVWIPKARFVWQQHNGKIPKGYKIIHKDGNKYNNSIENLEMIATGNLLMKNTGKPLIDDDVLMLSRLVNKLTKQIKKHEQNKS